MTKKRIIIILIVIAVIGSLISITYLLTRPKLTLVSTCQSDFDCVLVSKKLFSNSCCPIPCAIETVNKEEKASRTAYERENCFKDKSYIEVCGDVDCVPENKIPKCISHTCQLVEE